MVTNVSIFSRSSHKDPSPTALRLQDSVDDLEKLNKELAEVSTDLLKQAKEYISDDNS